MKTLYLDMDGVVADFDAYARDTLGLLPSGGMYPSHIWKQLAADDRLYLNLPLTPYANQLVAHCQEFCQKRNYQFLFLTAIPKGNDMHWAIWDKVLWAQKHFPGIPVHFGPYSKDKYVHCQPGDILIDDRLSNIQEWQAASGVAIRHQDISTTLLELEKLDQSSL
jgi:hypothetical protein